MNGAEGWIFKLVMVLFVVSLMATVAKSLFAIVLNFLPWIAGLTLGLVLVKILMEAIKQFRIIPPAPTPPPAKPRPPMTIVPPPPPASPPASPPPVSPPPKPPVTPVFPQLTVRPAAKVEVPDAQRMRAFAEAITALDGMIGLNTLKDEINGFIDEVRFNRERSAVLGISQEASAYHMIFAGSPGTGKTTVARLMGKILAGLGILQKGHVVETDRSGLVGEYIGHTAQKTLAKLNEARGGILFIDEAYGLNSGSKQDFGREVIDTLVPFIENARTSLVVIMAGYTDEMAALLDSNPGLPSRFNHHFNFDDHTPAELRQILDRELLNKLWSVAEDADAALDELIADLFRKRKPRDWANGREMRNLGEALLRRTSRRVLPIEYKTREDYQIITLADVIAVRSAWLPMT